MIDEMTPLERKEAFLAGKTYDRTPVFMMHGPVSAKIAELSGNLKKDSLEFKAFKEIIMYKKYGLDELTIGYGLSGLGKALGSTLLDNDLKNPAALSGRVLESIEDVDKLSKASVSKESDTDSLNTYRIAELIFEEVGHEAVISYNITGPITSAQSIIDPKTLFKCMKKDKDSLHKLLRFVTDCLLLVIDEFLTLDFLEFNIVDPVSSGSLISPQDYAEFCLPYTKELVNRIKTKRDYVQMHLCGDISKLYGSIIETGINLLSIDNVVSLKDAKDKVGDKVTLIGNIDPMRVFLYGNPTLIKAEVKKCFTLAGDNPKGYIIGAGCSVPYDTPLENIETYIKEAKRLGKQ